MAAAFALLFCNSIILFNRTCVCTRLNGYSRALLVIEMLLWRVKTTNDDVAATYDVAAVATAAAAAAAAASAAAGAVVYVAAATVAVAAAAATVASAVVDL